ncbi:TrkH family potassium uptake protein [Tautonia plasticadhaerens]|uniref:Potassium/sodium uptake protein NtpJ n=1 Tax=Tautonia plasticadhaerens TaxID=2527974 RepID=A0A518HBU0_9BACT|nr:potassium transporter TrkG [Tautonia plasticadhaerens]QDV38333.1 Potassium/sodium uptake protein NtpJ [Tautonia plasticadhaerens]
MSPVRRRRVYKWELDSAARTRRATVQTAWEQITPEWLFLGSFLAVILIGTIGLRFVPFFYADERAPLGLVDALFTATSAVCVTGLIVVDTATYFSVWGKLWLLALIQVGGLGIITFTTFLIAAMGGRPSLRQEAITSGSREAVQNINYRGLARHVILFTLLFEAAGFVLLSAIWVLQWALSEGGTLGGDTPVGFWEVLGHAAFHSVSAFCNAGFSTFSDSVIRFQNWPLTLGCLMSLIVVGGLGFLTLEELYMSFKARRAGRGYRMSLHSKVVLGMTALLLLGAWPAFAALEWGNSLSGMPAWAKLVNAMFMGVTPRTAGFNNINYVQATVGSNFLTILLMFIGGAPGSTAGGLKVTTVALPALMAWSRIRGRQVTGLLKRTVPEETIQRAVGLVVLGFALVTGCILLIVISEGSSPERFLDYMFEAVSAFDTVGLSRDTTPGLSVFAKLATIVLMFLGRVGLPTVASALTVAAYRPMGEFRYAQEDVVIG